MVTLRIDGLEFGYPSHPVLSEISIDIRKGEVVSIVGRNGAGKSTLIKCINGILKPRRGAVLVEGQPTDSMSRRRIACSFGYLPQRFQQFFPATVFETVLAGRYPHSPLRFKRRDEEIAAEALTMIGLGAFASRRFDSLSGGEQQLVLIARAIAQGASILLFDEPTANLDLPHQIQILKLIRTLAEEKRITSIIAIHDLNYAAAYSDLVAVLHEGTIFAKGKPSEVFTKEIIEAAFGVEVKIYDHHGIPHIAPQPGCRS